MAPMSRGSIPHKSQVMEAYNSRRGLPSGPASVISQEYLVDPCRNRRLGLMDLIQQGLSYVLKRERYGTSRDQSSVTHIHQTSAAGVPKNIWFSHCMKLDAGLEGPSS